MSTEPIKPWITVCTCKLLILPTFPILPPPRSFYVGFRPKLNTADAIKSWFQSGPPQPQPQPQPTQPFSNVFPALFSSPPPLSHSVLSQTKSLSLSPPPTHPIPPLPPRPPSANAQPLSLSSRLMSERSPRLWICLYYKLRAKLVVTPWLLRKKTGG